MPTLEPAGGDTRTALAGTRRAYFPSVADNPVDVPVYTRELLRVGHSFAGPAIVEQYDSTTVICPEQSVTVDGYGNLIITTQKDSADD
jgi:N-methylhydantoinase A